MKRREADFSSLKIHMNCGCVGMKKISVRRPEPNVLNNQMYCYQTLFNQGTSKLLQFCFDRQHLMQMRHTKQVTVYCCPPERDMPITVDPPVQRAQGVIMKNRTGKLPWLRGFIFRTENKGVSKSARTSATLQVERAKRLRWENYRACLNTFLSAARARSLSTTFHWNFISERHLRGRDHMLVLQGIWAWV